MPKKSYKTPMTDERKEYLKLSRKKRYEKHKEWILFKAKAWRIANKERLEAKAERDRLWKNELKARGKLEYVKNVTFYDWRKKFGEDVAVEMITNEFATLANYKKAVRSGAFVSKVVKGDVNEFLKERKKKMRYSRGFVTEKINKVRERTESLKGDAEKYEKYKEHNRIKNRGIRAGAYVKDAFFQQTSLYAALKNNKAVADDDRELRLRLILLGLHMKDWRIGKGVWNEYLKEHPRAPDEMNVLFLVISKDELRKLYFFARHEGDDVRIFKDVASEIQRLARRGDILEIADFLVKFKKENPRADFLINDVFNLFNEKVVGADELLTAVRQADWTDEGLILDYEIRDDVVFVKRIGGAAGGNRH